MMLEKVSEICVFSLVVKLQNGKVKSTEDIVLAAASLTGCLITSKSRLRITWSPIRGRDACKQPVCSLLSPEPHTVLGTW